MSNVRGKVAIDVQFSDSTTSAGVQSLKTITLQDATEHRDTTPGFPLKVVVLSGTVGTNEITVANFSSTSSYSYRNAAGVVPQFSGGFIEGVGFSYTGGGANLRCIVDEIEEFKLQSRLGRVAVQQGRHFIPELKLQAFLTVDGTTGQPLPTTGTYRIVVWGA